MAVSEMLKLGKRAFIKEKNGVRVQAPHTPANPALRTAAPQQPPSVRSER